MSCNFGVYHSSKEDTIQNTGKDAVASKSYVMYFDQLLGAASTQKLVETFFQPFFNIPVPSGLQLAPPDSTITKNCMTAPHTMTPIQTQWKQDWSKITYRKVTSLFMLLQYKTTEIWHSTTTRPPSCTTPRQPTVFLFVTFL